MYARKRGYLKDKTNGGTESSSSSDEEEIINPDQGVNEGGNGTGEHDGENGASSDEDHIDNIDNIDDIQLSSSKVAPGAGDEEIDEEIYNSDWSREECHGIRKAMVW